MATANDLVQDASLPVASSIMASDNHDPEKSAMVPGGISGATNVGNREPPMSVPVNKNKGRYSSPNGSFFYGASNSLRLSPDTGRRDRPSTNGRFQPYERKPLSRKSSQNSLKDEEMFSSSPEKANENGLYFLKVGSASPTSKLVLGSPDGPSVRKKHSPGKENMSACVHNFPSQSSPYASRFHKSRFEVPPEIQEQQMMSGSTKQKLLCTGATIDGTPPTPPIPMLTNGSPLNSRQTSPSPDEPTIQDRPLERQTTGELIGEKNYYLKRIQLLNYAGGHQRHAIKSIKLNLECTNKPTLQLSLCHSGVEGDYSLKLVANVTFPTKCPQVIRESIVKLAVKVEDGQTQCAINEGSVTFALRENPEITQLISYEQLFQSKCVTFSLKTQIFLCEFHPDDTTGILITSDCQMVNIPDFEGAVDIRYTGVPQP